MQSPADHHNFRCLEWEKPPSMEVMQRRSCGHHNRSSYSIALSILLWLCESRVAGPHTVPPPYTMRGSNACWVHLSRRLDGGGFGAGSQSRIPPGIRALRLVSAVISIAAVRVAFVTGTSNSR